MKTIRLVLLALIAQGCFYHPYYKDSNSDGWYFEEWDINHDLTLDKREFISGFEKYKMIKKINSKSQPLAYPQFDSLVAKMSRETGEHPEEKATAASIDLNGDQKLSEPELAAGMFSIADENKDSEVSGIEFYVWEVYL